MISELSALFWR